MNKNTEDFRMMIDSETDFSTKEELILEHLQKLTSEGRFSDSLDIAVDYLEEFREKSSLKKLASLISILARSYYVMSDDEKSIGFYLELSEIFYKLNMKKDIAGVLNNVSGIYYKRHEKKKSIEYLQKCINLLKDEEDTEPLISVYTNLGYIYIFSGEPDRAISALEEALVHAKKITDNRKYLFHIYTNLAEIYFNKGKEMLAFDMANYAESIANEENNNYNICTSLRLKASFLSKKERLTEAITLQKKALKIAKDQHYEELQLLIYDELGYFYENLGDYENAVKILQKYLKSYSVVHKKKQAESTQELELKFDNMVNEKEKEIFRLKNVELENALEKLQTTYDKLKKTQEDKISFEKINTLLATIVTANHEINQPLMVVLGNLELIEERTKKDEKVRKHIQKSLSCVQEIRNILCNLNSVQVENGPEL